MKLVQIRTGTSNLRASEGQINESWQSALSALAGMSMAGTPTGEPQTPAQQMSQAPNPRDNYIHGVRIYVDRKRANEMIQKAKTGLKNLEFFQAHILPVIAGTDSFWKGNEQMSPKRHTRSRYFPRNTGQELAQLVDHYKDQLRLFASYTPDQIVQANNFGRDRGQQERLTILAMDVDQKILTPLSKLVDKGDMELVSDEEYANKKDPRSPDQKNLENFTARYQNYIEKIGNLPSVQPGTDIAATPIAAMNTQLEWHHRR